MKNAFYPLLLALLIVAGACNRPSGQPQDMVPGFLVSFPEELTAQAQDGRLLLMLSRNADSEPRFQIGDGPKTQLVFGLDVEGMQPGQEVAVGGDAFGYPVENLADLPAGEYYVQALLNRYETFNLATGHTVKLPPDRGEGQQWNRKPGNFFSTPAANAPSVKFTERSRVNVKD